MSDHRSQACRAHPWLSIVPLAILVLTACSAGMDIRTGGGTPKATPSTASAAGAVASDPQLLAVHAAAAPATVSVSSGPINSTYTVNALVGMKTDPTPPATGYQVIDASQTVPKLADRYYVGSVLAQVFGPAANPLISSLISNQAATLGAPCDRYGHPGVFDCPVTTSFTQAPVNPVSTASRGAWITRACEGITVVDATIAFAAAQVSTANVATTPATPADASKLYGLFSPYRSPTTAEQSALAGLATASMSVSTSPIDSWRYILLALCLAPRWQLY